MLPIHRTAPSRFRHVLQHAFVVAALAGGVSAAFALEITLPPETTTFKKSDLPGYALVERNCVACHSAQYAASQPPAMPRSYWDATVKKMKHPFGAQFPDADIPAMVDYLSKTYGAESTSSSEKIASTATSTTASAMGGMTATASTTAATGAGSKSAPDSAMPANPEALLDANNCSSCHAVDQKVVGPAFKDVAKKYAGNPDALKLVVANIRAGGGGKWGPVPMPPFPQLSQHDVEVLARYVLSR
jgi:cytochrome c551/c552